MPTIELLLRQKLCMKGISIQYLTLFVFLFLMNMEKSHHKDTSKHYIVIYMHQEYFLKPEYLDHHNDNKINAQEHKIPDLIPMEGKIPVQVNTIAH